MRPVLSTIALTILAQLLAGATFAQDARKLYRLSDENRPFKGYLLGPLTGGSTTENFETCAGQRMLIDVSLLQEEAGSCDGGLPGTLSVRLDDLVGTTVYGIDQQPLGLVIGAKFTLDGGVEAVTVKALPNEITTSTVLRPVVVTGDEIDLQKAGNGVIQVIYNNDPQTLTSGFKVPM